MNDIENIGAVGLTTALCNALGSILKGIPGFPDWLIPVALPIAGMVGMVSLQGLTPENAVHGFLAGSAAVGLNQAVRNVRDRK